MKRFPAISVLLIIGMLVAGADGCSSDPNVEGAKLDLRNKDYGRALENLETALATNPQNAEAYELKGRVLAAQAAETLDPTEHVPLVEQMLEAYDLAVQYDPTMSDAVRINKAYAYVGEFQLGIQAFNRAQTDNSEFAAAAAFFGAAATVAPDSAGAYVNQGYALLNTGDPSSAIGPLEMAVEKGDTEWDTYRILASLYQTTDRADDAVTLLESAAEMYPNNPEVQGELLNAYQLAGQTDQAMATYASAVANNPDNKLYRYNYGSLLVQTEQYDAAIEQLEAAVALDAEYANAHYNLGAAYINKAVNVNDEINTLDDDLRTNRASMSDEEISAAETRIDELAETRRELFESAITPLESAKGLLEATEEDVTGVCQALYQSYVQTNQLDKAEGVSTCAGYDED